jgi:tetratricopeptide (TPR) repeat protein
MAGSDFEVERVRLAAARHLPASCHDDFLRLSRTLVHGPAFQWLLVDAADEGLRKQVMAALDDVLHAARLRTNRLPLSAKITDVAMLEARLIKNARAASVVHVIGRPGWFDAARWDAFNARRERLAAEARARLVFWLDAESISLASLGAPDLWAWRSGVYAFVPAAGVARVVNSAGSALASEFYLAPFSPGPLGADTRSMAQRSRRVAEIRSWLASQPAPPDELLAAPLNELGDLLFALGDIEEALRLRQDVELPLHRRRGDARAAGITQGQIAEILSASGQFDEALRLLRDEVLPVFERVGDAHAKAVTLGKIADILHYRGQMDEAFRIRMDEQLPVYERLGDVRNKAVTMARIADFLQTRGQIDEAFQILRNEVLPAFESLGDVRNKAVIMGLIADFLQARGQFDEALRICKEEVLPVYELLGDVRAKADTMGRIAGILKARGQFDEALRIRKEEQLPAYDHLGDVAAKAVTMGLIGLLMLDAGEGADDEAKQLLTEALADLSRLGLPQAEALAEEMRSRGLKLPAT